MSNLEMLDLVDENDNVVGQECRSVIYENDYSNFRVINIFLFNSKGELLVPKRSMNRSIFPGCYDMSVGGHVDSGEEYEQCAYRELKEELGIEDITLEEIGYFKPTDISTSCFSKLYKLIYDGEINYDKDGIESLSFYSIEKVKKMIKESPNAFKSDFPKFFDWYVNKYDL